LQAEIDREERGLSPIERRQRGKKLFDVIKDMEVAGTVDEETRVAYEDVIGSKVRELAETIKNKEEKRAFIELVDLFTVLIEFGVMTSASLSGSNFTVKSSDALIDNLKKENVTGKGAFSFNFDFNLNLFVNSAG